jgi:hypothetical protein
MNGENRISAIEDKAAQGSSERVGNERVFNHENWKRSSIPLATAQFRLARASD